MHVPGHLREGLGKYKNYIFITLLALLTLHVIVPQLDALYDGILALKDANLYWILAGIILFFSGIPILAVQIMQFAIKPIPFWMTYKVEMASLFVSKLLPSFIGTISINMFYLMKKRHTASQATTVMSMNALASGIAYSLLIILALTQSTISLDGLQGDIDIPTSLIFFGSILFLGLIFFLVRSVNLRTRIRSFLSDIKKAFSTYRKRPLNLVVGIICNGLGSSANIFALYASAHAIGVDLTLAEALLGYTFGNIATSLIPTPGGIGAAEAGIYSGLVLAGIDGPDAIIITTLYRLISYWLPIIPGYYYFWGLRKNLLADYSFKKGHST